MPKESIECGEERQSIWFISKYCRLPHGAIDYHDVFQKKGAHPARSFSILRELSRRGHDCTLFHARHGLADSSGCSLPSAGVENIDNVRVVSISVFPYVRAQSLARVIGWLHFEWRFWVLKKTSFPRPSVIVVSSLSLLSVVTALFYRWWFGCKLIFEVRDVWPLVLTENGGYSKFNPLVQVLGIIEKLGYKYADHIVATMPNLSPHVSKVLGYQRNVTCIPMGLSDELISERPDPLYESLVSEMDTDKFVVTYVGSIGVDNALDAFFSAARQLSRYSNITFRIFGSGDLLERYIEENKHYDDIVFCGSIPHGMVRSVLERSSLLYFATHPSVVLEYGQSLNKLIDYMYSGRPILASHTGYESMLNEAGCGVFIKANDDAAICREVVKFSQVSEHELDDMGNKGREWLLNNRKYEVLASQYEMLFRNEGRL